jgi:rhodanese-related sulfurtransferase
LFKFRYMNRAAGVLLLLTSGFIAAAHAEMQQISVAELDDLLRRGVTVIDVRRIDEWRATGIVPGSRMITAFDAEGRLDAHFSEQVAASVPSDQPVVLICRSGNRSARASRLLSEQLGFQHVYNLDGGIQAWLQQRRPVAPCPSC